MSHYFVDVLLASVHGIVASGIALMALALLAAGTAMVIVVDIETMGSTIVLILVAFRAGRPTWVVASLKLLLILGLLLLERRWHVLHWWHLLHWWLHLLHRRCRRHLGNGLPVLRWMGHAWLMLCRWERLLSRRKWRSRLVLVASVAGTLLGVVVAKCCHAELLLQLCHLCLHGWLPLHGGCKLLGEHCV
jgi:hypothetical protein